MAWASKIVIAGALLGLCACGGAPVVQVPTENPTARPKGPEVLLDGSALVLIEGSGSTPLVIHFEVDSDAVDPIHHPSLDALSVFLHNHRRLHIEVQGHADERGSDAYNQDLSLRRANAVRQYLVDHGVEAEQLSATGFGERQAPPAEDETVHQRQRRVEFVAQTEPSHLAATATASR